MNLKEAYDLYAPALENCLLPQHLLFVNPFLNNNC
jgi:hypothetical protein